MIILITIYYSIVLKNKYFVFNDRLFDGPINCKLNIYMVLEFDYFCVHFVTL
jgi:hypothetical protein